MGQDDRLMELEIKFSHQEASLETLQELVYQHEKTIARLESVVSRLAKRVGDLMQGDGQDIGPAHEPPPHY